MLTLKIRPAEEKDIDSIAALEPLCFDDPWTPQMIRSDVMDIPFSTYVLGEVDEKLVGYVGIMVVREECQVNNVAVHPDYRKKGIGGTLLKTALSFAKQSGAEEAFLEVREGNDDAISLYESMGFKRLGIRKGYYENNGENAVVMRKDLTV